ncbi:MAG TPA: hypothetical protein VFW13_05215, partial [Phenylobacterium sp.]|nr:hypothetical protein [Phenylobacterium sp.]
MAQLLTEAAGRIIQQFAGVLGPLAACALVFATLAWLTKGRCRALADARAAGDETKINAVMVAVDTVAVGPMLAVGVATVVGLLGSRGLQLDTARVWALIGRWPTVASAVVLGDFFGYWRHRAQHSRWLWPAHAIH